MIEKKKNKKYQWLNETSIMVRLIDSQREGHFSTPWDMNFIDPKLYLPPSKVIDMAYNEVADTKLKQDKRLRTIVPNNGNPYAFNTKITEAVLKHFNMTHLTTKELE